MYGDIDKRVILRTSFVDERPGVALLCFGLFMIVAAVFSMALAESASRAIERVFDWLIDPTFTDALFICGVLGLILGGVLILINQEGRVAYELTPLGIMVHGRFGSRFAGWREVVGMERRTKSIALQLQPGSNAGSEIVIYTDRIDRNGDEIEVLVARQCPNLFRKY